MEQDRKDCRRKQNDRPRVLPLDAFFDKDQPRRDQRNQDRVKND